MKDSREIIMDSLNHRDPTRVPADFGGSVCTGMHASLVEQVRDCLGLEKRPVRIHDVGQMIGYVEDDMADALELDVVLAMPNAVSYGYPIDSWKEWRTPWGQEVLVPGLFTFATDDKGDVFLYARGDRDSEPSGHMPYDGLYFDTRPREVEFDEDDPDPKDNLEEFGLLSPTALDLIARASAEARKTDRAVLGPIPGGSFSNVNAVPGPGLPHPKGIRSIQEWYMSLVARPDFVRAVFEGQADVLIANLELIHDRIGDDGYDIAYICGADFGTQNGLICSEEILRDLLLTSYRRVTDWVHQNTPWKTMKHCCGAVEPLMEFFIEAGWDIMNPVQCSARGMDPAILKERYGDRLTFWGGGVETQTTLAFGSPEEVRREALDRCRHFSPHGGFVFSSVHNVQARTSMEKFFAMMNGVREFNGQKAQPFPR